MIKQTLQFKDLDGNPVQKDYYFHLTQAELVEMQLGTEGGLREQLTEIIESKDGGRIMAAFKKIILAAIGERSEDNISFIKNDDIRQRFEFSEAYSAMFMGIVLEPEKALEFIKGVVPANLVEQADFSELEALAEKNLESLGRQLENEDAVMAKATEAVNEGPIEKELTKELSRKEVSEMSLEELRAAVAGRTEIVVKDL